ncbi:MAG TPA: hypothetical protein VKB80_33295, partial [Kofleriaceae bacterium]|nr:hypothetical protein [Kofleriaceae bacterium]
MKSETASFFAWLSFMLDGAAGARCPRLASRPATSRVAHPARRRERIDLARRKIRSRCLAAAHSASPRARNLDDKEESMEHGEEALALSPTEIDALADDIAVTAA